MAKQVDQSYCILLDLVKRVTVCVTAESFEGAVKHGVEMTAQEVEEEFYETVYSYVKFQGVTKAE